MEENKIPAAAQSIIELGKIFENLNATEKRLYELKVEKGQLEHDVNMFQVSRVQEKEAFLKEKADYEGKIQDYKDTIAGLELKKNQLAIEINSEMGKIAVRNNQLKDAEDSLRAKQLKQDEREKSLNSTKEFYEKKRIILEKLREIASTL